MKSMLDHYGAKRKLSVQKSKELHQSHNELPMIKPALRTAVSGSKSNLESFDAVNKKKFSSRVESPSSKPVMLIQ
jgi:hypothetical protein